MSWFQKVMGAFCVTAVLAGCGGSSDGQDDAATAGSTESAQALRTAAAAGTKYTITVSGQAGGLIGSQPAGIVCGEGSTQCSASFAAGTQVMIGSRASSGYTFKGWSGGSCTGTDFCYVTMSQNRTVVGSFVSNTAPPTTTPTTPPSTPPTTPTVTYGLQVSVTGSGSITSAPAGVSCTTSCTSVFYSGTPVTLTPAAGNGYSFGGWSGACSGTGTCTVQMNAAASVGASFTSTSSGGTGGTGTGTGKSYFVASNGSDSNAGTSLTAPFKTINKAVGLASAGDTIDVRAGTYTESVVIRRAGSASAWITLRGYNGERPVIKSTSAGPTVYFYNSACDEDAIGDGSGNTDCYPMYWVVQGLEIQGSASGSSDGNAIKIDTPKVKLIGNRLCCSVADIVKLVRTSNDVEVLDNEIWQDSSIVKPGSNAQGVDIVGADRVRIAGNYIHDVPDIGIYAKGNARNPVFENNRLVNIGNANNGHALMLGQETDDYRLVDGNYETYDGIVRNNVVIGSTWACLATSSSSNARFYNNSCYDTGRLMHGSIFISNESEIGQAGTNVYFGNNIIFGSSAKPVVKIGSSAMTDYKTLVFDHNVYYSSNGNPTFASDDFSGINFATWLTKYKALSGRDDTGSKVADPKFSTTTGSTPLTLSTGSPAVDAGANQAVVPSDIRGVKRAQGASTDIGAYEY